MDREILFRGKRIDNGEWVEGCLLIDYVSGQYFIHARGNSVNESDKVNEEGFLSFITFEVDDRTVCQYTGLTDRSGKRIFEGDIVNCHEKRGAAFWCCKVVWNEVKARFDVIAMGCAFPMCMDNVDGDISINGLDYEIIGNIFDNPELYMK